MIDAQSIVVATSATHQQGHEAAIFKAVFRHRIVLMSLVGGDRDVLCLRHAVADSMRVWEGSRMKRIAILMGAWGALAVGTTVVAQTPAGDVDTHVATARAAAGQDYRATFVNLCLPAAGCGAWRRPRWRGWSGGWPGRRGACRWWRSADAGSIELVPVSLQGLRQSLLARDAPAFLVGAAHQRWDHHRRHELRLGDAAGDHRRPDDAGPRSARHQVHPHQPRARQSRSRRGRTAAPIWRESGDGHRGLGRHASAPGDRSGRCADARHRSGDGGPEAHAG